MLTVSIGRLLARALKLRAEAKLTRSLDRRRDLEAEADRLTGEAEAQSRAQDDAAAFARRVRDLGGVWFPGDG